jgi:hypothetical protein
MPPCDFFSVGNEGLEPSRLSAHDPKFHPKPFYAFLSFQLCHFLRVSRLKQAHGMLKIALFEPFIPCFLGVFKVIRNGYATGEAKKGGK